MNRSLDIRNSIHAIHYIKKLKKNLNRHIKSISENLTSIYKNTFNELKCHLREFLSQRLLIKSPETEYTIENGSWVGERMTRRSQVKNTQETQGH